MSNDLFLASGNLTKTADATATGSTPDTLPGSGATVLVTNNTTARIFIKFGNSLMDAIETTGDLTDGVPVPVGQYPFEISMSETHFSVIAPGGDGEVDVTRGKGR